MFNVNIPWIQVTRTACVLDCVNSEKDIGVFVDQELLVSFDKHIHEKSKQSKQDHGTRQKNNLQVLRYRKLHIPLQSTSQTISRILQLSMAPLQGKRY